eukprot:807323-Pelagomonas_calceolata.AAC.4
MGWVGAGMGGFVLEGLISESDFSGVSPSHQMMPALVCWAGCWPRVAMSKPLWGWILNTALTAASWGLAGSMRRMWGGAGCEKYSCS